VGVVPTTIHTHRGGAGNIGGQTVADHQHVLRRETTALQAEGKETRVRFFSPDLVRYEKTGKIGGQVCLF